MKGICILCMSVVVLTAMGAKPKKDPVLMTVAGKDVHLSEFIYMAKKDNNLNFNDKKAVAEYVELYKNLKLKVADAEAMTIHQGPLFEQEMADQMYDLQMSYLSDKEGEDAVIYEIYERLLNIPGFYQIFFRFPPGRLVTQDTVTLYARANEAYTRILNGESFEAVGESIAQDGSGFYSYIEYFYPLREIKVWEDQVFSMQPGDISRPIRTDAGYHLIKLDKITPNPGKVRVAQIFSEFPSNSPSAEEIEEVRRKSNEIYQKTIAGEDFAALAREFSNDADYSVQGGLMPAFGLGEDEKEIVETAFAMKEIGEISQPVQTRFGFHILKLVDRKPEFLYEEQASILAKTMRERNDSEFELFRTFDEKMKVRHKYVFYPDAYEDLKRLADEYFPLDSTFIARGLQMDKLLFSLDTLHIFQNEFVYWMALNHLSYSRYSLDFMQHVLTLFIHHIVRELEAQTLERDYPEYRLTRQEYYDGNLVFEITRQRVWRYAEEEQARLEKEWVKELNEKYPVTINQKVVKRIRKYVK